MVDKKITRTGLKVSFMLIQSAMIVVGVGFLALLIPVLGRLRGLVSLPCMTVLPVFLVGVFSVASGVLGCVSILRRNRLAAFAFILALVALMNLEVILSLKSGIFVENSRPWLSAQWSNFTNAQRNFVQQELACCGMETSGDRPGTTCSSQVPCVGKFLVILEKMRNISQKTLAVMFFLETVGLSILALLRFGK